MLKKIQLLTLSNLTYWVALVVPKQWLGTIELRS